MAGTVADYMTTDVLTIEAGETVRAAAELMRRLDVGDVVVTEDREVVGILTDRDIVVRVLGDGKDQDTLIAEACSRDLTVVSADSPVHEAVETMRTHAVRRLPVVEEGALVGVVSIGDLAQELDPFSALSDISSADPNL